MAALLRRGLTARSVNVLWGTPAIGPFSSRSASALSVQLYQYEICPFCCKVKAFLDWQKQSYRTIEVNPLSKAEIKFSEKYRKVPIAMVDGEQVNDSLDIIKKVAASLENSGAEASILNSMEDAETQKWLTWADKELAVLLFPNITRNFGESFEAFQYISEVPTFGASAKMLNQLAGSLAMWLANGKLKKKYNITDERKQLSETLETWVAAVGDGPFLRGSALSVADVAVYGVISSIRGLAAHKEAMAALPALAAWSDRVRASIGGSMREEEPPVKRTYGLTAP